MSGIVIIGGSFGGLTAAFELKRQLGKGHDITLICDQEKFVFIPSLPWLCMGWCKPEDITLGLKGILESRGIKFVHAEARKIDPEGKRVIADGGEFSYDYLVIATGPHLAFDAIKGFDPALGYTKSIFTLGYAIDAHKAWKEFVKEPGPIVIGAAQGASCFGPAYELAYMVDGYLRKIGKRRNAPLTFVTSEPFLGHMGLGGVGKSRRAIEDEFAERDIKAITNAQIEEITAGEIKLKDGQVLKHKFSMIVPPFRGVDAIFNSPGLGNPKGFVPVDKYYRHPTFPNIYTVGVAIAIAPPEATPVPVGVPKTGYMTEHMAKAAAKNIAAAINGREMEPHEMDVFCVLDKGDKAIFMYANPTLPPRNKVFLKDTRLAHYFKKVFAKYFLWKMRYGLTQLP